MAPARRRPTGTKHGEAITFSPMHDNVFEAMGLPDATERLATAEMLREIALIITAKGWTPERTATAFGTTTAGVADLLRGKLTHVGQAGLIRMLNALDMDVRIQIGPRPAPKARAGVTVERVASF